jgi:broad specificity phosphatase PhoE
MTVGTRQLNSQLQTKDPDHDKDHTMNESLPEVYLARHGETAWSLTGQHTGRTDIPLTERGEDNARRLKGRLLGITFTEVLVSPLQRAMRTCELAGFSPVAQVTPGLMEWDYGSYEGRRTADIRRERPGWYLFRDGCPGGESLAEVGARADRMIARLRSDGGRILLFGHAHFFRILAARWLGLATADAKHFLLSTASLSIVGYEHTLDDPAIVLWNDDHHANPAGQERMTTP